MLATWFQEILQSLMVITLTIIFNQITDKNID